MIIFLTLIIILSLTSIIGQIFGSQGSIHPLGIGLPFVLIIISIISIYRRSFPKLKQNGISQTINSNNDNNERTNSELITGNAIINQKVFRIINILMLVAVLVWISWVAVVSKGFTQVQPMGWLIFFLAPLAVYTVVIFSIFVLRKVTKGVRYAFSISVMWFFIVGAWGYIWDWENVFSSSQYFALFILPPIGFGLGLVLWGWSKND